MKKKRKRKKRMTLHDKAFAALKEAVRKVVEEHKKSGRPLAVWKNGKVALGFAERRALISPWSVK